MTAKGSSSKSTRGEEEGKGLCCSLPVVPERELDANIDPYRASLIRNAEKKWVNHTLLHYHFLETPASWRGGDTQKNVVRDKFGEWKALGIGLEFKEVAFPEDAEIRIGFLSGDSWSAVGRDSIDEFTDPNERTMNFGWNLTTAYGLDTALHEIGHALGFPHEHQNPNTGIVWNEEAVYDYFGGHPNYWPRWKTKHNVIRKISPSEVDGSAWDKDSIMHYNFVSGLIRVPEKYQTEALNPAPGLSTVDIDEVRRFYPGAVQPKLPELKPYLSHLVQINPGEQLDFVIKPTKSRKYNMGTFGEMDTVMVLFEDVSGEPVYIDGDDDSGSAYNAQIETRLHRGRTYYLRLRLYYAHADGEGGIMIW